MVTLRPNNSYPTNTHPAVDDTRRLLDIRIDDPVTKLAAVGHSQTGSLNAVRDRYGQSHRLLLLVPLALAALVWCLYLLI